MPGLPSGLKGGEIADLIGLGEGRLGCIRFSAQYIDQSVWNTITKESTMQMLILLFLIIAIVAYVGYTTYRSNAERRAIEKKRNQYHDRV
jgi:hypothetical protein